MESIDTLELFDASTIDTLLWPDTVDGQYAKAYLVPLMKQGADSFIDNIFNTELRVAKIGDTVLPLTLSDFHPQNSYTVSPYNHYIAYGGFEETKMVLPWWASTSLRPLFQAMGLWFELAKVDKVVYVNNWLLSTNLYPELSTQHIAILAKELPKHFPNRAVVFRSVDDYRNSNLYTALTHASYSRVISRKVYYQEPDYSLARKQIKTDQARFRRSDYELVDGQAFGEKEIKRAVELYNLLYLEKYSYYNPQFNEDFVRLALEKNLLYFKGVFRKGCMDGVVGYFVRNGVMTQPFFGYDTALPQKLGLYSFLSLVPIQDAKEQGLIVNASAGVGPFKKLRGGQDVMEFNFVYSKHLSRQRRAPWQFLNQLTDKLAVPVLKNLNV